MFLWIGKSGYTYNFKLAAMEFGSQTWQQICYTHILYNYTILAKLNFIYICTEGWKSLIQRHILCHKADTPTQPHYY